MSNERVAVANAPRSYGAFEITVGVDPLVPEPLELLDDVEAAGYAGIDLGPLGYLGSAPELAGRLRQRHLTLAGGYFAVPFSDPAKLPEQLERLASGRQRPRREPGTFASEGSERGGDVGSDGAPRWRHPVTAAGASRTSATTSARVDPPVAGLRRTG